MTEPRRGIIYLLHFTQPVHHAMHYVGYCNQYEGLDSRFDYHAKGRGSRLVRALIANGGDFKLARLWRGTRNDERRLKRQKNTPQLCPICAGRKVKVRTLEEIDL